MTGPESALFLRELYDREFYKSGSSSPDAYYFGAVIKREEEKLDNYNYFREFVEEYHKVGIKKYFGITIIEYLNLTSYEKNVLCDKAAGFAKEELEMARQAAKENNNELKGLQQDAEYMNLLEGDLE